MLKYQIICVFASEAAILFFSLIVRKTENTTIINPTINNARLSHTTGLRISRKAVSATDRSEAEISGVRVMVKRLVSQRSKIHRNSGAPVRPMGNPNNPVRNMGQPHQASQSLNVLTARIVITNKSAMGRSGPNLITSRINRRSFMPDSIELFVAELRIDTLSGMTDAADCNSI